MTFLLLDTNVVSYLLKPNHPFYEACLAVCEGEHWCISFMTRAELAGWPDHRNWGEAKRRDLEDMLSRCATIYPDEETCALWARVIQDSRRSGRTMAFADAWIAATALQYGIPLVTADYQDFAHLTGLDIYRIS